MIKKSAHNIRKILVGSVIVAGSLFSNNSAFAQNMSTYYENDTNLIIDEAYPLPVMEYPYMPDDYIPIMEEVYKEVYNQDFLVIEDKEFITTARVNLRVGPSTDFDIITTMPFGEVIYVSEFNEGGWSRVSHRYMHGYVKSEFIATRDAYEASLPTISSGIGNVELLHWNEVRDIFTVGVPAQVYDIRTGITYYVKSFSNGRHADVDPITTNDTALLRQTFGGTWSWDVRPVLVTINGRTIAASINGMPHGGSAIENNGMNGHICIHFLGSSTHNGNAAFSRLHQDVLMEAYRLSSNR